MAKDDIKELFDLDDAWGDDPTGELSVGDKNAITQAISQQITDGKMDASTGRGLISVITYGSMTVNTIDTMLKNTQQRIDDIASKEMAIKKTTSIATNNIRRKSKNVIEANKIQDSLNDSDVINDLDSLMSARKKQFSALQDFELMPMIVPSVSRVLSFLRDECLSPDIQNDNNFIISLKNTANNSTHVDILEEIQTLRESYMLDYTLSEIYMQRAKLGSVYYRVVTFKDTLDTIMKADDLLNESFNLIDNFFQKDEESFSLNEAAGFKKDEIAMKKYGLSDNIEIEISYGQNSYMRDFFESCKIEKKLLNKCNIFNEASDQGTTLSNNGALDKIKQLKSATKVYQETEINRCYIERLDPSRVFPLKVAGRILGYIFLQNTGNHTDNKNFTAYIKDMIKNSSQKDITENEVKNKIVKNFGEKLLSKLDIDKKLLKDEDIDLFHDYLINSVIPTSKTKYVFYTKDEIFDFSRSGGSLLTNAIYEAKLLGSLQHNNVITKILRGRSKMIHTVNVGVGNDVGVFIENAIDILTRPESRIGDLTGSFANVVNSNQGASDIVIPSPDGNTRYITTDLIDGMNIDMDSDMLKYLTNNVIMAMNVNPAILDPITNSIDFAKTIAMISKEVANFVKNEQNETMREFSRFVKTIFNTGSPELQDLIKNGQLVVKAYRPSSLSLAMKNDEINSAKTFIDTIIEMLPNVPDDDTYKKILSYEILKIVFNLDFNQYDSIQNEVDRLFPQIVSVLDKKNKTIEKAKAQSGDVA